MMRALPILTMIASLGCSFSSAQSTPSKSPLDHYLDSVRAHRVDPIAMRFATDCSLDLKGIVARYGFANDDAGTWRVVKDLPKAYDNLEMDLVGTAEWWPAGDRFVVEEWSAALDVGGFSRTLYCFGADQKLQMLDSSNFQIPIDGGMAWGMHERWVWNHDGRFTASTPFQFIGLSESPIAPPKLDKDDQAFAKAWGKKPPRAFSVTDLKLPGLLKSKDSAQDAAKERHP